MSDIDDKYKLKENELRMVEPSSFGQIGSNNTTFADPNVPAKLSALYGTGSIDAAITNSLRGFDIFNRATPAQPLSEQHGLIFFTRPMLNLSYDNCIACRTLTPMVAPGNDSSLGRYVRALLDPLGTGPGFDCPLLDKESAFMPILSNTLETLSGWQDPYLDTWSSAAGVKRQQYTMPDSSNDVYAPSDISATFRNIRGNVLGYLFHVWQRYMALEVAGKIDPHLIFMEKFTVDYHTRIYHLVLDPSRQYVEDVICTGASFPLSNPAGARGNYNKEDIANTEVTTINQSFRSMGMHYYDPGYMIDFNTATGALRSGFNDLSRRRSEYRILWPSEYKLFTYKAFPHINITTARLEWWVSRKTYVSVMGNESYDGMPENY